MFRGKPSTVRSAAFSWSVLHLNFPLRGGWRPGLAPGRLGRFRRPVILAHQTPPAPLRGPPCARGGGKGRRHPPRPQRHSPTKTAPQRPLSSPAFRRGILFSPQGMGRARGQRPSWPWGAVERGAGLRGLLKRSGDPWSLMGPARRWLGWGSNVGDLSRRPPRSRRRFGLETGPDRCPARR